MKDLKIFVAYSLFALCMIAVCLWGMTQDYKYSGNPELEDMEGVIGVNQDVIDLVIYVHEVGKQKISAESVLTLLNTLNV